MTSNSFQFGGRVKIVASVEILLTTYTAEGWFGVNVLLLLEPFTINARATAGVTVSAGDEELLGVDLHDADRRPAALVRDRAREFTFFGIDVPFEFDIGNEPGASRGRSTTSRPTCRERCSADRLAGGRPRATRGAAAWSSTTSGRPGCGRARPARGGPPVGRPAQPDDHRLRRVHPDPERIDAADVTLGGQPVA